MTTRTCQQIASRFFLSGILFIAGTYVTDVAAGPLFFVLFHRHMDFFAANLGLFLPLSLELGVVCVMFAFAAKSFSAATVNTNFYASWFINTTGASVFAYLYYFLVLKHSPAPVLYKVLEGDMAQAVWTLVVTLSAILPLHTFFQLYFASPVMPPGSTESTTSE